MWSYIVENLQVYINGISNDANNYSMLHVKRILGRLYVEEFYSRIYIDGMLRRYHGKAPNLY
jgi:hypothetical protein